MISDLRGQEKHAGLPTLGPMTLRNLYRTLAAHFDASHWWPAESRFEIAVGAILTQNTSWHNVALAIERLKNRQALTAESLLALTTEELEDAIRPAGFYRAKGRYLRHFACWFQAHDGVAAAMPTETLRSELLQLHGLGPETVDDILLYVYERPLFIYDLYARRLFAATSFGEFKNYQGAKAALDPLVQAADFSVEELKDFHGLIVEAGKTVGKRGHWDVIFDSV